MAKLDNYQKNIIFLVCDVYYNVYIIYNIIYTSMYKQVQDDSFIIHHGKSR